MGGKLDPCLPDDWLIEYPDDHDGRPCPYVELAPQNTDAYFLATLYISEDAQPLLTPAGIAFGLRHEWKDVRAIWARINRALRFPNVTKALEEWREQAKVKEKEDAPEE